MRTSLRVAAILAAAALALTTAACSSGGGGSSGPVKLNYWTWVPNMDKVVAIWNKSHPDIQVTVNKQDGGDPAVTKLLTAIKAGSGAPDVMQAEYQKLPTLVSANALIDISADGGADAKKDFNSGTWNAVTLGGDAVYAIPQDTGPMMFFYRADVFQQLGLSAPKTWDDYAADARAIHQANPNQYLGTFSSGDAGWFAGLTQQAGASWWSINGKAWGVDVDSAAAQKVAKFWGGLVQEGVIGNTPFFTPEWNADLNSGNQVGWVSAVWAPGVLAGNAADTKGKWAAAPLPQWDASKPADGNWGGSSTGVTTQSKHPKEATEFAVWLNTDPTALKALVTDGALYPAATAATKVALGTPPDFFSGQSDFYDVAATVSKTVTPFTYGPNVNVAYSAYNDEFAKAAQAKEAGAFTTALSNIQTTTRADLVKSGFTVK